MKRSRALTLLLACVVGLSSVRGSLSAQTRPVGLVHGFGSGPTTWDDLRSALSGYTQFTFPSPPLLSASSGVSLQSGELLSWKGALGLGANLILVGHSQGGLVARAASRTDSVSGLVTIGTPHLGAYIASAKPYIDGWWIDFAIASGAVGFLSDIGPFEPLYIQAQRALVHAPIILSNMVWVLDAALYALPTGNGSLTDMTPGSTLLSGSNGLNTQPGLEKTGQRYAIVGQLNTGYEGGPARLLPGMTDALSDFVGLDLVLWSFQLEQDALDLSEITGFWHVQAVFGLQDMSALLYNFAPFWAYAVVGGVPNDVVVPSYSQAALPNANLPPFVVGGISHLEETKQSVAILGRIFLVP